LIFHILYKTHVIFINFFICIHKAKINCRAFRREKNLLFKETAMFDRERLLIIEVKEWRVIFLCASLSFRSIIHDRPIRDKIVKIIYRHLAAYSHQEWKRFSASRCDQCDSVRFDTTSEPPLRWLTIFFLSHYLPRSRSSFFPLITLLSDED